MTTYQGHIRKRCFEFSLGFVFADTPEEAERIASENGMWNRRLDGSWGRDASEAHAQLCRDEQAAYRSLARRRVPVQTYDPDQTERELRAAGRCAHQTGYGLPWFEYCGQPLPCSEHEEGSS